MLIDPLISFDAISLHELNSCLDIWGHRMGPINRPTPTSAHGLRHSGRLVAVTATDHLMAAAVKGLTRADAIELSRVCAERPDLCRVAVRLWREFIFPAMKKPWAISYQDAVIHGGNLYRFDGWVRIGFSHSGKDTRSGRPGRDKYVWAWNADPAIRASTVEPIQKGCSMTENTAPLKPRQGLTQEFIEQLAEDAGGEEYGPRTWNMAFKRDALHRFADSIARFCQSALTIQEPASEPVATGLRLSADRLDASFPNRTGTDNG